MTTAVLGLEVHSGSVVEATPALEKMAAAAKSAESAARQLAVASRIEETATASATTAAKLHAAALQAEAAASRMMANNQKMLAFQLNDVVVSLAGGMNPAMVALQQGSQIAQLGLKEVGQASLSMAGKFGPAIIALAAVAAGIAGMTYEINKASAVTVTFGDVALATWQVISDGIVKWIKPAVDALAPWFADAWDGIVKITHNTGNMIVQDFVGTTDYIVTAFSLIPDAVVSSTEAAANMMLSGIEEMIQQAIGMINGLITDVNGMTGSLGVPALGTLGSFKMGRVDIGGKAAQANIDATVGAYNTRQDKNYATDYMGQFFGAVSDQSQANALARMAKDAEKAEKSTKSLADKGFGKLAEQVNVFAEAARSAFSNMGTGIIDAFKKGGNVAANILSMIADRVGQLGESLLNSGLNGLFDIGIKALFGGVLGNDIGPGASFGQLAGFLRSANGNVFPSGVSGYSNSIVSQPTIFPFAKGIGLMGEAGPEAIMPLRRGPDGRLGVAAATNDNGPSIVMHNTINANSEAEGAAAARGFSKELDRLLPAAMERYNRNPYRRTG